jgi:hypothetical protein
MSKTTTRTRNGQPKATDRDREIARMAQARSKPAAPITAPNIARLRERLGRKSPLDFLGVSPAQLGKLSTGKKVKLTDEQREQWSELQGIDRATFYGKKLGGMLYAIQQEKTAAKK